MADFTNFKTGFCECCDTKRKNECRLGYIRDNKQFIDWESFINFLGGAVHDLKHCDAVYVQDDNRVCFIEQKNLKWFVGIDHKAKPKDDLLEELLEKCRNSEHVFKAEYKQDIQSFFFCSYDLNNANERVSVENIRRMIRNTYSPYFSDNGIYCDTCKNIANIVLYNTI